LDSTYDKHNITVIGGSRLKHDETIHLMTQSMDHNNDLGTQHHHKRQRNSQKAWVKRQHFNNSGCPKLGNFNFTKGTVQRLTAPDFFCNLQQESHQMPPPIHTKIVHFVRDPIDMALSNYLYHSQDPTPEVWVSKPSFDPCKTDVGLFQFVLPLVGVQKDQLNQVKEMCLALFQSEIIVRGRQMPTTFYRKLQTLPRYDALRLATAQFLIASNEESGSDLLRMPNNILRIKEYQKLQDSVLTVAMNNLVRDTQRTVTKICNFIFKESIPNFKTRLEVSSEISAQMVASYQRKNVSASADRLLPNLMKRISNHRNQTNNGNGDSYSKASKTNLRSGHNENYIYSQQPKGRNFSHLYSWGNITVSHITQKMLNQTERRTMKEQLEKDEIVGPILLKMRTIVDNEID
jgi:hypothetical protein